MMAILMTHREEYRVVPASVIRYDLGYRGGSVLHIFNLHNHDSLEILLMREGAMDVHLDGQTFRLTPGDAALVNPYVMHTADFVLEVGTSVVYDCLMLELAQYELNYANSLFNALLLEICQGSKRFASRWRGGAPETAELSESIEQIKTLYEASCVEGSILLEGRLMSELYRLLTLLASTAEDTPAELNKSRDLAFIRSVNEYMETHYTQPITSQDVCTELGFSRRNFTRLFRRSFGTTFTEYLREYRIGRAATEFRGSKLSVYEVAAKLGFPDYCSFSRAFKRILGISPSQYFKR